MAEPPPPNQRPPNPDDPRESVDALAKELRKVVTSGLAGITANAQRPLLALRSVERQAHEAGYPDNDDGLVLGLRDVISDALGALGPGDDGVATRLLFGAVADSAGRNLGERRRLAGNLYDVVISTFRQSYEPRLVREVAVQILRAETKPDLRVVTNPDRPERTGDSAPLHVVIDTPATALALHATAPTAPADTSPMRRPRRLEWFLLALVTAGALWWAWGLGAVLRVGAVALAAGLAAVIVGAVREGGDRTGIARALLDRLPRLVLLGAATAFALGAIAATDPEDPERARRDPCTGIARDPTCTTTTTTSGGPATTTDAERSPNYVPHTLATAPATRSADQCPPAGNKERRLSWVDQPPMCININGHYLATVTTNFGEFRILLNTSRAPYTVNNFAYLAGWRFFDGITLTPDPQPLAAATSMRADDPVAEADTDKVPGYGMTYDKNIFPDLPTADKNRAYVVMTDEWHASRWDVVISDAGRNEVEGNPARWPLLGQVSCGLDVIASDVGTNGFHPAYTSAPIVIEAVTVAELQADQVPDLDPGKPCPDPTDNDDGGDQ